MKTPPGHDANAAYDLPYIPFYFIHHPRLAGIFSPDTRRPGRAFGSFVLHEGVVSLGEKANLLNDRELGAIALEALGFPRSQIARVYQDIEVELRVDPHVSSGVIQNHITHARRKLNGATGIPVFPLAIARDALRVAEPSQRTTLSDITDKELYILSRLCVGESTETIGGAFQQTGSPIRKQLQDMFDRTQIDTSRALLAIAVMEQVINPYELIPNTEE